MRRLLVLLGVVAALAAALVIYAWTDAPVAGWAALILALALPVVRFLIPLTWLGGEVEDFDFDFDV